MRFTVAVHSVASSAVLALATLCLPASPALASISIKDRTVNEPLVLDQNDDYVLDKVYVSGVTDVAALTLTGKINSVNLSHCVFSNVWAGMNGKAVAAESQGAIVNSFVATDSAFEDAQHQLLCLREGAFGTVTFQRCKFRTTDSFLKKVYSSDPWRTTPPTTEFANIDRLELLDNEYVNTTLVIHPSVKVVIFRGDITNVRLQSPGTQVFRLERGQDPATIHFDGTAVAMVPPPPVMPAKVTTPEEQPAVAANAAPTPAAATADAEQPASEAVVDADQAALFVAPTPLDSTDPALHTVPEFQP